jgi:hypothetical protein
LVDHQQMGIPLRIGSHSSCQIFKLGKLIRTVLTHLGNYLL